MQKQMPKNGPRARGETAPAGGQDKGRLAPCLPVGVACAGQSSGCIVPCLNIMCGNKMTLEEAREVVKELLRSGDPKLWEAISEQKAAGATEAEIYLWCERAARRIAEKVE